MDNPSSVASESASQTGAGPHGHRQMTDPSGPTAPSQQQVQAQAQAQAQAAHAQAQAQAQAAHAQAAHAHAHAQARAQAQAAQAHAQAQAQTQAQAQAQAPGGPNPLGGGAPQMQGGARARIQCHYCGRLLEYDAGAQYVQCFSCYSMNAASTGSSTGGKVLSMMCAVCHTSNLAPYGYNFVRCGNCGIVSQVTHAYANQPRGQYPPVPMRPGAPHQPQPGDSGAPPQPSHQPPVPMGGGGGGEDDGRSPAQQSTLPRQNGPRPDQQNGATVQQQQTQAASPEASSASA